MVRDTDEIYVLNQPTTDAGERESSTTHLGSTTTRADGACARRGGSAQDRARAHGGHPTQQLLFPRKRSLLKNSSQTLQNLRKHANGALGGMAARKNPRRTRATAHTPMRPTRASSGAGDSSATLSVSPHTIESQVHRSGQKHASAAQGRRRASARGQRRCGKNARRGEHKTRWTRTKGARVGPGARGRWNRGLTPRRAHTDRELRETRSRADGCGHDGEGLGRLRRAR